MTEQPKKETRKLAAIMFTDIAGYTALMAKNEKKALEVLQRKRDTIKPLVKKHNGEFLKEIGDGTLSSFHSAVEAVNCAREIQFSLRDDADLNIRIGIHIGDVVFSGKDVFGDGVNIASRIETLAPPGGVCISEQVYNAVRSMSDIETVFIGEKTLKNVSRPIKIYALSGEGLQTPEGEESRTISHYKILEKIGEGGMGAVYRAEDTELRREVALKFLPYRTWRDTHKGDQQERFKIEARSAAALSHPNIATIYEIGEAEGETFIAMEYVKGETLKDKINTGPLNLNKTIDLSIQIAEGLEEAHQKGITHRDIKSQNIMINEKGKVKITDFGLAKMSTSTFETKTGTVLGTTSYMSPQQARGEEVDHRSDIWSAGVVMYEMLTGQLPFRGEYEQAVIYSIINTNHESVSKVRKDIPAEIEEIINKALEKDIENRFQSISELKENLLRISSEKDYARTSARSFMDAKVKTKRFDLRKLTVPAVVAAVILAVVMLFSFGLDMLGKKMGFVKMPSEKSLVVLPITNIGEDPENQVFCDGLAEYLTSGLTRLEKFHGSLWVIPSADVRQRNVLSAGEAREKFGVNLVITGSMHRFNGEYQLALNLVDTENLRQLRSDMITNTNTNLAVLQDAVIMRVARMLQLELEPQTLVRVTAGGTTDDDAYKLYMLGKGYLLDFNKPDNINIAIRLFKQATEKDPQYALAYAGLGEAYWRKYNEQKDIQYVEPAIKNCERAFDLNNLLSPVRITLGLIYIGTGELDKAVNELQQAITLDPDNSDAYRELGKAYRSSGKFDEAESAFKKAIEIKPEYWGGYNLLGGLYLRYGRYEDAVAQYKLLIKVDPLNARGYRNLGGAYFYWEKHDEAIDAFNRSLEIKEHFNAYSNLGTLYFYKGQFAESARMFEKARDMQDLHYQVWGNLASAYHWTPGERDKAEQAYRKAIELAEEERKINPNDTGLLTKLATYYGMIDENSKAEKILKGLEALNPEEVQFMFDIGDAYEITGNREKAIEWISKALKKGYPLSDLERAPGLKDLREDKRFIEILKEIK